MATDESDTESCRRWYCVRTKPKSEHLAAAHLGRAAAIEVFCPRIRFQRATRRGKVWFVEALFPGYLFARFDLESELRRVKATPSVSGVLHFRDYFPVLPSSLIDELRREVGENEPRMVEGKISEGDEVLITAGAMKGLNVLVTKLMPGQERVRILLEWLGQEREADISIGSVANPGDVRARLAFGQG